MVARLPLSALLSQALVAFTIELDNEFEHQMPHRTTTGPQRGSRAGPWLVSLAMWSNFLQFVPEAGVRFRDLEYLARITNLAGLERWGYIDITPREAAQGRRNLPGGDALVRPTRLGQEAQRVWRPLPAVIERRWETRFGSPEIGRLRDALNALGGRLDRDLPWYLPVVAHDMFAPLPGRDDRLPGTAPGEQLDLPALLSRALLALTADFESGSKVSLPISANALRVLEDGGARVRDLPQRTGVSKEAISTSLGVLERRGYVVIEPDAELRRTKVARLTTKGLDARAGYLPGLDGVEASWRARFDPTVDAVRDALEALLGAATASPPWLGGLEPYPDGWRSGPPEVLPHYPMVLHRGGFPDGA